ncbi:hypothetical protein LEP1GSC188_0741 [Leptospira weilii serovar Topaz str. LT2116]|uniref:Uncharacterized protein n=1 Tax=Leptospira weilii serovar Topaz str. LT2116 TaxID=1088540 RepID=M3GZL7_9LEPT|nr:hypothetical protein LEP1GSC188_0741 [Leptospira weilii serovar Topaz str. LT2116]
MLRKYEDRLWVALYGGRKLSVPSPIFPDCFTLLRNKDRK